MAKWFSGYGFAWAASAAPCSFSVRTAIADSAIAAPTAADKPGSISGVEPIVVTNKVRKHDSIIATGSGNTASAGPKGHSKTA
jgi:hypothetical protein